MSRRVRQMHHLPVTTLEEHLKRCMEMNPDFHQRVLNWKEMLEYITWMADNFGRKTDLKFLINDIPVISGGDIAKNIDAIQHSIPGKDLTDVFSSPSEKHFLEEDQTISCGRFLRYMPAYWQTSDCFEIYYIFSGKCPVWFENETVTLVPGNVLLIPPGIRKACCCPKDDCIMLFYMIRSSTFSRVFWDQLSNKSLMSLFFKNALNRQNNTDYLLFETDCDMEIKLLLTAIFEQYQSDSSYRSSMVNALMETFFVYLLQNYEQTARISRHSTMVWKPEYSALLGYIQDHYQTVTLKELAQVFGYSQRQLIRIIQNTTSKTFSALVTQLRMEKAASLLKAGNITTEEIAVRTGYGSVSSFYRAFTGYYGTTPGKWR